MQFMEVPLSEKLLNISSLILSIFHNIQHILFFTMEQKFKNVSSSNIFDLACYGFAIVVSMDTIVSCMKYILNAMFVKLNFMFKICFAHAHISTQKIYPIKI